MTLLPRTCRVRDWGPHRRWILFNAVLGAAVVNLVLNAGIAWLTVHGRTTMPLPSVLGDTVSTSFVLPLTTCLMCTGAVRRELAGGRLTRLRAAHVWSLLLPLPADRLRRGVVFGVSATLVVGAPVTALLLAVPGAAVSPSTFLMFKVLFAVALGILVTPLIAWRAMADEVGQRRPDPARAGPG